MAVENITEADSIQADDVAAKSSLLPRLIIIVTIITLGSVAVIFLDFNKYFKDVLEWVKGLGVIGPVL